MPKTRGCPKRRDSAPPIFEGKSPGDEVVIKSQIKGVKKGRDQL